MNWSLWRAYGFFRVRFCGDSPLLYETFEEMVKRQEEYFSRPDVIARLRSLPPTHTYDRATRKMTSTEATR